MVVLVLDPRQHLVVCDRAFDELDPRVVRYVLTLGREQVIDHEHACRIAGQQLTDQVGADEPPSPDDQRDCPPELGH